MDIFSAEEIARAAGAPVTRVDALVSAGQLRPLPHSEAFFGFADAVGAVRALRAATAASVSEPAARAPIFSHPTFAHASPKLPIAVSSTVHAGIIAGVILVTTLGLPQAASRPDVIREQTTRLVFLAQPGPGGGGGGGGLRQRAPAPEAKRKGKRSLNSPIPARKEPDPVVAVEKPTPPPPPPPEKVEPLPPVVAPVAVVAANDRDQTGVIDTPAPAVSESRGRGAGGGAGTGTGTGLGSGDGSGIGPGSGGGMGGGPYRPGSGVTPPRILREVKADYTEDARKRNIEGEVVLEIVVRRDGTVGDVTLIEGLPSGLSDRAIQAVRQWRFSPARRLGQPVDVIVEVAIEFKLR
jgi:protein TonB